MGENEIRNLADSHAGIDEWKKAGFNELQGCTIKIETRGSAGAKNVLTAGEFDGGGRFWYNGIPTEGESGHLCQNLKEI